MNELSRLVLDKVWEWRAFADDEYVDEGRTIYQFIIPKRDQRGELDGIHILEVWKIDSGYGHYCFRPRERVARNLSVGD